MMVAQLVVQRYRYYFDLLCKLGMFNKNCLLVTLPPKFKWIKCVTILDRNAYAPPPYGAYCCDRF